MVATGLPERQQRSKEIASILIQVAAAGLASLTAFLVFALDKRTPRWFFWVLVIVAVVSLAASIFSGVLGIVNLGNPSRGYFNAQTWLLILGWVFALASVFSVRASSQSELETINKNLETLKAEINQLRKDLGNEQSRRIEVEGRLRSIQESRDRSAPQKQPAKVSEKRRR